jgi:hypothetical protein
MIAPEWMGLALLALAWVTAGLIALDALIDARAMLRRLRAWQGRLVQGTARAPELAAHEVEQRVRPLDGATPGLIFFDRAHVSAVRGGAVEVGGDTVEVTGAPDAEVWVDEATRRRAAACPSATDFDALAQKAQGAAGGLRTVRTAVRAGQPVWLVGARRGARVEAQVVATFEPRGWVRDRLMRIAGLLLVNAAWVTAGTMLALWPPAFGRLSQLGAVVLIGHFLGMTPLAMAARERSRTPARQFIRGTWRRPTDSGPAHASA